MALQIVCQHPQGACRLGKLPQRFHQFVAYRSTGRDELLRRCQGLTHAFNGMPRAASLGLGDVAITVPGRDDLDALVARLRARNLQHADDGRSVVVHDPWGTRVTLAVPGTTTDELLAR